MEIPLKDLSTVTKEKVVFVEDQANRLFSFQMESRSILNREAHTTLNWFFGIIIASAGYIIKILGEPPVVAGWLVPTLVVVLAGTIFAAVRLFRSALMIGSVLPPGNEPKSLVTDEQMQFDEPMIRLAAVCQMQERIEEARQHNNQVANAINNARWSIVAIAGIAVMASITCRTWITSEQPNWNQNEKLNKPSSSTATTGSAAPTAANA